MAPRPSLSSRQQHLTPVLLPCFLCSDPPTFPDKDPVSTLAPLCQPGSPISRSFTESHLGHARFHVPRFQGSRCGHGEGRGRHPGSRWDPVGGVCCLPFLWSSVQTRVGGVGGCTWSQRGWSPDRLVTGVSWWRQAGGCPRAVPRSLGRWTGGCWLPSFLPQSEWWAACGSREMRMLVPDVTDPRDEGRQEPGRKQGSQRLGVHSRQRTNAQTEAEPEGTRRVKARAVGMESRRWWQEGCRGRLRTGPE